MNVLSEWMVLELLSRLTQGVILGIAVTVVVSIALRQEKRLTAATKVAVRLTLLIALVVITVLPSVDAGREEQRPVAAAAPAVRPEPWTSPAAAPEAPPAVARPASEKVSHARERREPFFVVPIELQLAFAIPALYALIAVCLFARLCFSYMRLRRLKRRSKPAPPEVAACLERWMELSGCRRPVSLMVSAHTRSPMAVGYLRPAVIIPEALLLELTSEQLDHAALHEFAHLCRYDDWTTLMQRIVQAIGFFHPAVYWTSRQLELDREVATDDRVVAITGDARPYAQSLTHIAAVFPCRAASVLASGAVFRKKQILKRIEMMLDRARNNRPHVSAVPMVLVLLVLVGVASEVARTPLYLAMVSGSGHRRSKWSDGSRTIETEIVGQVEFDDDDTLVERLSPGGYVRIEERNGFSRRRFEARGSDSGAAVVRFAVNGRERPIDAAGRSWIHGMVLRLIREEGVGAEERALRILGRRGPVALFDEIDRISSNHSRRRYLAAVAESQRLAPEDMRRVLQRVARLSSDHEKANLLISLPSSYLNGDLRTSFLSASHAIGSDHEGRRVLERVMRDGRAGPELVALVAASAERFSSDDEKAQLLKQTPADSILGDARAWQALVAAAATIASDQHRSSVLQWMLSREVPSETLPKLFEAAADMTSDQEKARVLERAWQLRLQDNAPAHTAYFTAVRTISSNQNRAQVLRKVLWRGQATLATREEVCKSVDQMTSDHEKANVLTASLSAEVPESCFTAVRNIASDADKRRVLELMLRDEAMAGSMKAAIETVGTVSSDADKAALLVLAAKRFPDPQARELVRKAAGRIGSDRDYREVLAALEQGR